MGKCTGWKLTDEDQSVDISVDYDFDPEEVTEGVYEITFSLRDESSRSIQRIIRRKDRRSA
mgnify:CR=1 FL=1